MFETAVLAFVIVVLLAYIGWAEVQHVRERRHLIHLIAARKPAEVKVFEQAVEPFADRPPLPDYVATPLPDDFDGFIGL